MLRYIILPLLFCLLAIDAKAQDDSLSVFRTNPASGLANSPLNTGFRNAVFLNFNHIARGGLSIAYERVFINPNIAIYAGYGISLLDYAGQFSFDADLEFYPEDNYSNKTMTTPGRIIDFGVKILESTAWDYGYIGIGYTFISNNTKRKIDSEYKVINDGPRSYNLNYMSNELKLVIGVTNSDDKRIYIDGSIGPGLRFLSYQKLEITDDPILLYNLMPQTGAREIGVDRVNELKLKLWLFASLKMGLRF